jgi:hypothetical protein
LKRNNALGVNDGVSKTMHALIFLPVDWMKRTNFILVLDVDAPGAGIVGKNTAHFIMTLKLENDGKMRKTIIMHYVVVKKKGFVKKSIVRVDTVDTVQSVGEQIFP